MRKKIIIATGNKGKLKEIEKILKRDGLVFKSLFDEWENPPEISETGNTFYENAKQKACWVFSRKGGIVMADDSGLEVDALNGRPGVFSSRYAGENADDSDNIDKLLRELRDVEEPARRARFRCVIVLLFPGGREETAEGICEGNIAFKPLGKKGFGYDPVFIPKGYNRSFAQLDSEIKNSISHRGKALQNINTDISFS